MSNSNSFTANLLATFAEIKEIDIETRVGKNPPHRVTIWVVVVGDEAFIRSYRGVNGIWYQQIRKNPDAVVYVGGKRIPVHAGFVRAEKTIAAVSAEYVRKYNNSRSAQAMVLDAVLPTTLRVTPRDKK